jgi:hypothetical protein
MKHIIAFDLKVEIAFSGILEENASEGQKSPAHAIFRIKIPLFAAEYSVSSFDRGPLHLIDALYLTARYRVA